MKKITTILLISTILLGIIFVFYPIQNCKAITISVDKSGGMQFTSIQEAINNATAGDTVYVYSGTYNENIIINKSIILTGENKQNTIIVGNTSGDIMQIIVDNVQISGFTIKNPIGTDMKCIKLLEVENCVISNNIIQNGNDGIFTINSNNIMIQENIIENNVANGIYNYNCNSNVIYKNIIRNNGVSGIRLIISNNNLLYLNKLSTNLNSNAYDNGNNSWYNSTQGNYWDDYNNYDNNNDGIGDTPYSISGGSNKDIKPLGYFLLKIYIQSVSPNPAIVGQTISFQGLITGDESITEYEWKAGSYKVGNQKDCQYSGLPAGTYTVTFRVKNDEGTWSDPAIYEQTLVVNPESSNGEENHQPIAHIITIFPSTAPCGTNISFQGYGQDEEDSFTSTFYWSSNRDGQIGSSSSFYKSDLSVGTHTITFKVRDSDGMWSEPINQTLNIFEDNSNHDNIAPVADAGGTYTGFTNQSISFNGSNSSDNTIIVLYRWSFGDGNIGSGLITNHTYLHPGTYPVSLTVTDNSGNSDTDTTTVTVQPHEEKDNNTSNNNTNDKWNIPGFEAIIILLVIVLMIIIKKIK